MPEVDVRAVYKHDRKQGQFIRPCHIDARGYYATQTSMNRADAHVPTNTCALHLHQSLAMLELDSVDDLIDAGLGRTDPQVMGDISVYADVGLRVRGDGRHG